MSEKIADLPKEVESMVSKVMRKKDLERPEALAYMLGVATGRLAALWRYETSLPDGKTTKGILTVQGRKKRADKSKRISVLPPPPDEEEAAKPTKKRAKPAKKAPKSSAAPTAAKKPAKKKPARKPKAQKIDGADSELHVSAS